MDTHDLFLHVRVVIGTVLGLSIARLLAGLARFVQHPGRDKVYVVHLGWVVAILLLVVNFWWWEFALGRVEIVTFNLFVFVIFYASLFYFLCVLLFPDDMKEYAGFEDYFFSRRKWFFGILALIYLVDVVDTFIKGEAYLRGFGAEYLIATAIRVALCITAMATPNRVFHTGFVLATIAYEFIWIFRHYQTLPNAG
jgi:hypothetical protein